MKLKKKNRPYQKRTKLVANGFCNKTVLVEWTSVITNKRSSGESSTSTRACDSKTEEKENSYT